MGDSITLDIGYGDDLVTIFKGKINTIYNKSSSIIIYALSSMIKLCNLYIDRFYEHISAGDIVKDIVKIARIDIGEISTGITFPYYTIDSNKNTYEHIQALALLSGFDLYCTNDDKVIFKEYAESDPHTLEYGKNIIEYVRVRNHQFINQVRVFGDSPVSFGGGDDKAHWIRKERVEWKETIENNNAIKTEFIIYNRALKRQDDLKRVAKASIKNLHMGVTLMLQVVGNPNIKTGDTVNVQNIPNQSMNGTYKVVRVKHSLNKSDGFTSMIWCNGKIER
jgi:hypothetical protein